jgi:copper oxidase (laccase) domain-containing protein
VVVHRIAGCTVEDPNLHSHRRDGARAGRLGALVWLTRPA